MYIGINKFSASASDYKPLHEYKRKLPIYASRSHYMNTSNSMFMYQNVISMQKVARYTV